MLVGHLMISIVAGALAVAVSATASLGAMDLALAYVLAAFFSPTLVAALQALRSRNDYRT